MRISYLSLDSLDLSVCESQWMLFSYGHGRQAEPTSKILMIVADYLLRPDVQDDDTEECWDS